MSQWDWEQLYNPPAFNWKYGVTPFSNAELIGVSVVIYLITIFSLQVGRIVVSRINRFFLSEMDEKQKPI